jgi:hypothetical protein
MRYELTACARAAIKSMLPNKRPGVSRANDRRVLHGIFWVRRWGHRGAICHSASAPKPPATTASLGGAGAFARSWMHLLLPVKINNNRVNGPITPEYVLDLPDCEPLPEGAAISSLSLHHGRQLINAIAGCVYALLLITICAANRVPGRRRWLPRPTFQGNGSSPAHGLRRPRRRADRYESCGAASRRLGR